MQSTLSLSLSTSSSPSFLCHPSILFPLLASIHPDAATHAHLRGIDAAVGVGDDGGLEGGLLAAGVAGGVGDAGRGPDAPGALHAVRARDELVAALQLQLVVVAQREGRALAVLGGRLRARGVAEFALAYFFFIRG